ncbi:MAG: phosphatidate cytidylyltransferase [Micropruina sp.]|uniref:phosphatidate cytidylyltransferase n=1 Tax=Micropruina sp. TaxID=2737536 RepID=UPI0039E622B6
MSGEQEASAAEAVARKSRAGRDLPAAIMVGLALAATVVLTLLYWHWGFVLLVTAMLALGTVELHDALKRIGMNSAVIPIVAGTVAVICGSYAAATQEVLSGLPWHSVLLGFLGATTLAALIWRMPAGSAGYVKDAAASLFTIGYIPLLGSFTSLILASHNGAAKMATILLVVMGTDTGGYAVGARWGKHPMAPQISPKKTWEGMAGSVALASVVSVALTVWVLDSAWWIGLLLALAIVAAGTCGDLIESLVKRDVGIKDMSSFLPGHGGAMDRLDSILVAAPVAWLILYLLVPN